MTSSPGPMPSARRPKTRASVPEPSPTACRVGGAVVAMAFNLGADPGESLLQRLSAGRLTLGQPGAKQPQADPYVPDGERLVDPLYRSARPSNARQYGHAFENTPQISAEPHFVNYLKRLSVEVGFRSWISTSRWRHAANELPFHRDDTH